MCLKKNPMRTKLNCEDANSSRDLANELESLDEALETMTVSLNRQKSHFLVLRREIERVEKEWLADNDEQVPLQDHDYCTNVLRDHDYCKDIGQDIASVKEEIREKLSKVDDAFRRLEYFRQQIASLTIRH